MVFYLSYSLIHCSLVDGKKKDSRKEKEEKKREEKERVKKEKEEKLMAETLKKNKVLLLYFGEKNFHKKMKLKIFLNFFREKK